ncbi:MAG: hypothetical protein AAF798_22010 [Bacteroidota bacterium]
MQADDYQLIDHYLRGTLDAAGEQQVRARLQADEAFAEELQFQQELQGFMQQREKRAALETQLRQLQQQPPQVVPMRRRILFIAGVAAAVAALVYFAWPFLMPSSLYEQFNQHQPLALQERGDLNTLMTEAEQAFNTKDFELAYAKLQTLTQQQDTDVRARLALGIAALETDRLAEAETIFTQLRQGESAVTDGASWYLGLTYVKKEDWQKAQEILGAIPAGTFWAGKAQALLKQLTSK